MVEFKLTISDPKAKRSYKKVIGEPETSIFIGKKINDVIKDISSFKGYEFVITGGSDKQGFPMRPDLPSASRKRLLMTSGPGARINIRGVKRRKMVVGNTINANISQINLKVSKSGAKSIEEILGIKKEEVKEATEEVKKESTPQATAQE